jgi:hypothetical protein
VVIVLASLGALTLAIVLSRLLIPALHARGGAITTAVLELTLAASYIGLLARRGIVPSANFAARFLGTLVLGLGAGGSRCRCTPCSGWRPAAPCTLPHCCG